MSGLYYSTRAILVKYQAPRRCKVGEITAGVIKSAKQDLPTVCFSCSKSWPHPSDNDVQYRSIDR